MNKISSAALVFSVLFGPAFLPANTCESFTDADYQNAERLFKKNQFKVSGVTKLHIAAATGDLSAIEAALSEGAAIDAVDSRGFTAAHFAAMRQTPEILKFLEEKGANLSIRNIYGASTADFWSVLHLDNAKDQRINIWDEATQEVTQIDGETFCDLIGAAFVTQAKIRPQTAMKIWAEGKRQEDVDFAAFREIVKKFAAHDSPYTDTFIKKISVHEENGDETQLGYGLFANRDFEAGEIVGEYEGEWKLDGQEPEYTLTHVDASKLRGYMAFAADGAPNAIARFTKNRFGVPEAYVVLAIRPIKKGEAIMWDYGPHDTKWEVYKELEPQNVDLYLGSIVPADWLKNGLPSQSPFSRWVDFSIIQYIGDTPTVAIRLALEGKLTKSDLRALHQTNLAISQTGALQFESILRGIERAKASAQLKQFFLKKAKEGNIQVLISALYNLGNGFAAPSFMTQLKGFISGKSPELLDVEAMWLRLHELVCSDDYASERGPKNLRGGCYLLDAYKKEL